MKKILVACLILLGLFLWTGLSEKCYAASSDSRFSVAGIHSPSQFKVFYRALQDAVATDNRNKIAQNYIAYPLRVNIFNDKGIQNTIMIDSPEQLLESYANIFGDAVRYAIITQDLDDFFINWKGVCVGRGEVWINADPASSGEYQRFLITNINLERN